MVWHFCRGTVVISAVAENDARYVVPSGGVANGGPERWTITALSLSMLRQRIEAHLCVHGAAVRLVLYKRAWMEHDQRRRGGAARATKAAAPPSCHRTVP
jgi:hypothetical protein